MNQKRYYIYINANKKYGTLYVGITSKLLERIQQHKNKEDKKSFTARYNVDKLMYYEEYSDARSAIAREKQIKAGSRKKKIELIESANPEWNDLTKEILR